MMCFVRGEFRYEGGDVLLVQFLKEPLAVGSKMMTLTVRYMRKYTQMTGVRSRMV
jgi:hypothetical protein